MLYFVFICVGLKVHVVSMCVGVCVCVGSEPECMQLNGQMCLENECCIFSCLGPQSPMDVCVCVFFLEDEYLNNILNDLPTPWTRSLELV